VAELKPIYLIAGSDRPKVQRAVDRLKALFDPAGTEHLSAESVSGEEAVAACNALGLFAAGGRLVIVTEVDGHRNREGRLAGGWKAADVQAVAAYAKAPAPDTVLALVAEEAKKGSPLAKVAEVLVYEAKTSRLLPWVAEQFAQLETKAHPDACRLLVELVGENSDELRLEVEKLALWAQGKGATSEEITAEHVEEMVLPRGPVKPWTLTDAWSERNVAAVLTAAQRLLRQGGSPSGVAWALGDHVALVSACRRFAAEGIGAAEATKRLKRRSEFPVRKAFAAAEIWGENELAAALVRLAELDVALKGGSPLPDELELERALVEVSRGPAG
jgi:DNA polymerase III subunit delta